MSLRPLQSPFAAGKWCVLLWVVRTLNDIATACHIEVTIGRAVNFIRKVSAVILFIASKSFIYTIAIGTMK